MKNVSLWYRFASDNASWGGWKNFGLDTAEAWSWSFTFTNGSGYYQFYTIATDVDGSIESAPGSADRYCAYEAVLPTSSVNALSSVQGTSPLSITATAADTGGSGLKEVSLWYRKSLDNSTWGAYTLVSSDTSSPYSWSFIPPDNKQYYQFYTIAQDNATNSEKSYYRTMGSTYASGGGAEGRTNSLYASWFLCPGNFTLSWLSAYTKRNSGTSIDMKLAVYEYVSATDAGVLLGNTSSVTLGGTIGWVTLNLATPINVVEGTYYYFAWYFGNSVSSGRPWLTVGSNPTNGAVDKTSGITFPTCPNPLTGEVSSNNQYSIYTSNYFYDRSVYFNARNWSNPLEGYHYSKKITIDHTKVAGNLVNFPVLIDNTSLSFKAHAQPDGDDFCFYNDGNTTKFNHEIERYDWLTGRLIAWVNVTSLSSVTDTVIWLYYGNAYCGSQQNKYGTWDGNYLLVNHMNGATYTALSDSTSNKNNVTGISGTGVSYQQTGLAGYGVTLTGSTYFTLSSTVRDVPPMAVEGWAKPTTLGAGNYWFGNGAEGGNKGFTFDFDGATGKRYMYINNASNSKQVSTNTGTASTGTWYYFGASWTGQAADDASFYVQSAKIAVSPVAYVPGSTINLCIGVNANLKNYPFRGVLDELRISKVARSDAWLRTSYNTSVSPSTFVTVGGERLTPGLNWNTFGNTSDWTTMASGWNSFESLILTSWKNVTSGWNTFIGQRRWQHLLNYTLDLDKDGVLDPLGADNDYFISQFRLSVPPGDPNCDFNRDGNIDYLDASWWSARRLQGTSYDPKWNTFGNTAVWTNISTGWKTFANQSSFIIIDQGWNTFGNISSWVLIEQGWNTFGNTSVWTNISTGWNTFNNSAAWTNITQGWNTFGNGAWQNVTQGWNTFRNTANWTNITQGWNTFANQSSYIMIDQGWNRFANGISWVTQTQGWNTFGNISTWVLIDTGWNTFGNASYMAVLDIFPANGSLVCPTCYENDTFFYFNVHVDHTNGSLMDITWTTWNGTVLGAVNNVGNGTYHIVPYESVLPIIYNSSFNYTVNVTDGVTTIVHTLFFTTGTLLFCTQSTLDIVQFGAILCIILFLFFFTVGYMTKKSSSGLFMFIGAWHLLAFGVLAAGWSLVFVPFIIPAAIYAMFLGINKFRTIRRESAAQGRTPGR